MDESSGAGDAGDDGVRESTDRATESTDRATEPTDGATADGDLSPDGVAPSDRRATAAAQALRAVLFVVALGPPLVVGVWLARFAGGTTGLVLGASSLWVTATVELVGYYAGATLLGDGDDLWATLRERRSRIKRLAWAVALVDILLWVAASSLA
jgi:hypothetical protein